VFLDTIAPGARIPSLGRRLDKHLEDLREKGISHLINFIQVATERRARTVMTIVRKPLRRLFPYHFRLENIADTWDEAFAAYDPTPYAGEAMLFRASKGFVLGSDVGRLNAWERLVLGPIEVDESPGDHSSMCEQPHVRVLARRLRSYLQRQVRDNSVRDANPYIVNEAPPVPLARVG
jgi:thioesterase domain-containing protein